MSDYSEYFLDSNASIIQLELISISHVSFSQTYNIVRNNVNGVTVDGTDYDYYPLKITSSTDKDDLDYEVSITFGDLGEILPLELDNIADANTYSIKPTVIYTTHRSDDLTSTGVLLGPITLEVDTFNFNSDGVSFSAKAPSANINSTGERYTLERFPMLKGFI